MKINVILPRLIKEIEFIDDGNDKVEFSISVGSLISAIAVKGPLFSSNNVLFEYLLSQTHDLSSLILKSHEQCLEKFSKSVEMLVLDYKNANPDACISSSEIAQ